MANFQLSALQRCLLFTILIYAWYHEALLLAIGETLVFNTRDYEIISEGNVYNLRLHNATLNEEGRYQCLDPAYQSRAAVASIYVIMNIPTCTVNSDSVVVAGDDVTYNCSILLNNNTPGDLVWYNDGVEVSRRHGHLNVWTTTLQKDDNGAVFNCQLEHYTLPPRKWSELACEETIVMDVQYPLDIEIEDENGSTLVETTIEGDLFIALCKIDANPTDNLNVHWEYKGITVHDGALLELQNVSRDQSGIYHCFAENMFFDGTKGYGSDSIEIDVQYPPSVKGILSKKIVKEGKSLTLTCHVIDANPNNVEFSWVLADDSEYGYAVVDIVNVTRELQGNHSCTAKNTFYDRMHGIGRDIIYLEVQYAATINMTVQPSHEVSEDSCTRITCTVVDGHPDPYLLRLTLDQHELISEDGVELEYEIYGFKTNDVGYYECQAFTLYFDYTEEYTVVGKELRMKIPSSSSNTGTIVLVVLLVVFVPIAALAGILLSTFYWKRKLQGEAGRKNDSAVKPEEDEYEHYTSILPRVQSESVYMKLTKKSSLEVSREFVCLKETLGEGVFGKVVKAEAWNIAGREGVTSVLLKISKEQSLDVEQSDFLRELDLMKSVGSHPHIVSLLGCCTEYSKNG